MIFDLVVQKAPAELKLYLDVGVYEGLLEANRHMRTALHKAGYSFGCREFNAGHHYPAWRDQLHRGLSWLYPAAGAGPAGQPTADKRSVSFWGKEFRKV